MASEVPPNAPHLGVQQCILLRPFDRSLRPLAVGNHVSKSRKPVTPALPSVGSTIFFAFHFSFGRLSRGAVRLKVALNGMSLTYTVFVPANVDIHRTMPRKGTRDNSTSDRV